MPIKYGKYVVDYKHKKKHVIYTHKTLVINNDSTFHYFESWEWPMYVTNGRWRIQKIEILLNSLELGRISA